MKTQNRGIAISLVALGVALWALAGTSTASASLPSSMVGPTWTLHYFIDEHQSRGIDLSSLGITAIFEGDGTLHGFAGCNSYTASYTDNGPSLTVGPIVTTQKACGDSANSQESTYLDTLGTASGYQVSGDQLQVYFLGTHEAMLYTKNGAAPQGVQGPGMPTTGAAAGFSLLDTFLQLLGFALLGGGLVLIALSYWRQPRGKRF